MDIAKKIIKHIRDIFEVYLPSLVFLIMFVVFILQIFFRYVINDALTWTVEATLVCFCWLVTLGACYAARRKGHVVFSLTTDLMNNFWRNFCSILGNIIIIVSFALIIVPSIEFVQFMSFQSTPVLKINMSLVFSPFVIMLIDVIIYQVIEMVEAILSIKKGEEVTLIDRKTETELGKYLDEKRALKEAQKEVEGGKEV